MGHNRFDSLLDTLKKSVLFSADFPKRRRRSHAECAGLGEEEHARAHEPGLIAIRRVKNARDLADAVKQLGKAKHAAAVPLLAELWADCALEPVRSAAGHALRTIGTPEARRALLDLIEDSDHLSVYLAVAAAFDEDSATAFDRLLYYFEPGRSAQPGRGRNPQCRPGDFRSELVCRRAQRGTDPPMGGFEGAVLAAAGPALGQTVRRPAARQATGAHCP